MPIKRAHMRERAASAHDTRVAKVMQRAQRNNEPIENVLRQLRTLENTGVANDRRKPRRR